MPHGIKRIRLAGIEGQVGSSANMKGKRHSEDGAITPPACFARRTRGRKKLLTGADSSHTFRMTFLRLLQPLSLHEDDLA